MNNWQKINLFLPEDEIFGPFNQLNCSFGARQLSAITTDEKTIEEYEAREEHGVWTSVHIQIDEDTDQVGWD